MSDANKEQKEADEQRPLGAVLGWLNLPPNLPDNVTGMTAGWRMNLMCDN